MRLDTSRVGHFTVVLTIAFLLFAGELLAVPAYDGLAEYVQPDGLVFEARKVGDEFWGAVESASGYTLLQDENGWWCWAEKQEEKLVAGSRYFAPNIAAPRALNKHLRPNRETIESAQSMLRGGVRSHWGTGVPQLPVGNRPALAILVEFADRALTTTDAEWAAKFFGPAPSVNDYFTQTSGGVFTLVAAPESSGTPNDGIVRVTLGINHPNPGNNDLSLCNPAVLAALAAADASVNFASFDSNADGFIGTTELAFFFIFAGFASEASGTQSPAVHGHLARGGITAPSHDGKVLLSWFGLSDVRSCGRSITGELTSNPSGGSTGQQIHRIGVLCHEYGHELGLPDTYDTSYQSAGLGQFCLMAGGAWNTNGGPSGSLPAYPCAWCRWQWGWATMVDALNGVHNMGDAATEPAGGKFRRVRISGNANEFFLIENRNGGGYDAGLPSTSGTRGLLIYHVDQSRDTNNFPDYLIDLEEASGTQDLEAPGGISAGNDFWRVGTQTVFDNNSTPDSKRNNGGPSGISIHSISAAGPTMSFTVSNGSPAQATVPAGSTFTGGTNGPFVLTVAKAVTLSNATIELSDPDDDQIVVLSITPQGPPPAGITAPPIPAPAEPVMLTWQGTTPMVNGSHTWVVSFRDALNGTVVNVDVTIVIADGTLPVATSPGGSSFVGSANGPFNMSVAAGTALSAANILLSDADGQTITVTSITPPAGTLVGVTPPPIPSPGQPLTLSWTGSAMGPPGVYTWVIVFGDVEGSVSINVSITVGNSTPTHAAVPDVSGNGTPFFPYTISITAGMGGGTDRDIAIVSDTDIGQTLAVSSITPPFRVSGSGTDFVFSITPVSAQQGRLSASPSTTLLISDAGLQVWRVRVTDGATDIDIDVQITINPAISFLTSPFLPDIARHSAWPGFQIETVGGTGGVTFGLQGLSSLPNGLVLLSDGFINGTTVASAGVYTFTIRATDSLGAYTDQAASITVTSPSGGIPRIMTPSLPLGAANTLYKPFQMKATGGVAPYTWSLTIGSLPLPQGLTLSSSGVLTGIPDKASKRNISIRVTDSAGVFFDTPYELWILQKGAFIEEPEKQVAGYSGSGCTTNARTFHAGILAMLALTLAITARRRGRVE